MSASLPPVPLVEVDNLGKDYGATVAVQSLSFEVAPGEVVGILGPNGAGKTTTMKLLLGLLRPTRGRARVMGLDCTEDARAAKSILGYCPDEPAFYDFLTGRETLDFVANIRNLNSRDVWSRVGPLIEGLEFQEQIEAPVGSYSHGTKKKLALVVAAAHAPRVLLLDEPTNGLDPPSAAFAKSYLKRQADAGVAVMISTHLLEMADGLCQRILVLDHGRIFADGPPAHVREVAGLGPGATLEEAFLRLVR